MELTSIGTGLTDISDSSTLNHVSDGEPLDGLIFGNCSRAVRATEEVYVATALLVATAISSLFRLESNV